MKGGGGYYLPTLTNASRPTGQTYSGSNVPVTVTTPNVSPGGKYVGSRIKPVPVGWETHATTFSIVLDSVNMDAVNTTNTFSKQDKINLFIMETPADAQGRIQFNMNGKVYYGYFSPSTKNFVIREISLK